MFLSPPIAHASPFQRMAVALLPVPFFSMKPYAEKFYSSKAWKNTRAAYAKSKRNLCELCLDKGLYKPCEIVHHKVELTPQNIDNPDVTLNWNNLQCLCREHHAAIHDRRKRRYKIDDFGRVITH